MRQNQDTFPRSDESLHDNLGKSVAKPLGRPAPNGFKYFSTEMLLKLREDTQWLGRASDAVFKYWQKKNDKMRKARSQSIPSELSELRVD